jgi:hypothetical protein
MRPKSSWGLLSIMGPINKKMAGFALFSVCCMILIPACKKKPLASLQSNPDSKFSFDVNDVTFFWPLLPGTSRFGAQLSGQLLSRELDRKVHPIRMMMFPGNPYEDAMIRLTPLDTNDLMNTKYANRSLLSEEDFRKLFCDSVKETAKNVSDTDKIVRSERGKYDPNLPRGDSNPVANVQPLEERRVYQYCGGYQTGKAQNLIPEATDVETSMAAASRGSIWRVVAVRAKLCAEPTKAMENLLMGAEKITKTSVPADFQKICRPTLRVVAQPLDLPTYFAPGGEGNAAFDFAMHLEYYFPVEKIPELIQDLVAIKSFSESKGFSTQGVPQFIHPGFGVPGFGWTPDTIKGNTGLRNQSKVTDPIIENMQRFSAVVVPRLMKYMQRENLGHV